MVNPCQGGRAPVGVDRSGRLGSFGGIADHLNSYNVYLGDPGRFEWDLDRYRGATVESLMENVRRYIDLEEWRRTRNI